jgi:hypothetical protein
LASIESGTARPGIAQGYSRRPTAFAAAAALLAGCGGPLATDYSGLNLVDVSGTVTLDGDPLPGAMVIFEAEDQTYSFGRTDEDGYYELMFNSEKSGVMPGRKIVRITMGTAGEETEAEEGSDSPAPPSIVIPARYNVRSELTADVTAERRTFEFDLQSR